MIMKMKKDNCAAASAKNKNSGGKAARSASCPCATYFLHLLLIAILPVDFILVE